MSITSIERFLSATARFHNNFRPKALFHSLRGRGTFTILYHILLDLEEADLSQVPAWRRKGLPRRRRGGRVLARQSPWSRGS